MECGQAIFESECVTGCKQLLEGSDQSSATGRLRWPCPFCPFLGPRCLVWPRLWCGATRIPQFCANFLIGSTSSPAARPCKSQIQ